MSHPANANEGPLSHQSARIGPDLETEACRMRIKKIHRAKKCRLN